MKLINSYIKLIDELYKMWVIIISNISYVKLIEFESKFKFFFHKKFKDNSTYNKF